MVRERAVEFKQGNTQFEKQEIKTWCCVNQGYSSLHTEFEKNIYTPDE